MARGGGPFSGFQEQGFISGLLDAPNAAETRTRVDLRGPEEIGRGNPALLEAERGGVRGADAELML